jgi:uncharacterized protein (TIGR00645 family)
MPENTAARLVEHEAAEPAVDRDEAGLFPDRLARRGCYATDDDIAHFALGVTADDVDEPGAPHQEIALVRRSNCAISGGHLRQISIMKSIERLIEKVILASRWILVVFYLGLAASLAIYAVGFTKKLLEFASVITATAESDTILQMLGLIDAALVASLVVMVMISGYENFVSRFDEHGGELQWLGKIDAGSLKVKVASTIVAISAIHLLQVFLNSVQYTDNQLVLLTMIHMAFVFSALFLGLIDKVSSWGKKGKDDDKHI